MKRLLLLVLNLTILALAQINAQTTPVEKGLSSITPGVIKSQLGFLASDWTEGRMAGEKGEAISADYIASILQLAGVFPGGDMPIGGGTRTYFQNFNLTKSMPGDVQILKVKSVEGKTIKTTSLIFNTDFTTRAYGPEFEIEAPVVFAGYCYKNEKLGYNDLKSIDVKGKFVMRIPGIPAAISKKITVDEASAYSRGLEAELKKLGAIGIIDINTQAVTFNLTRSIAQAEESKAEGTPRPGYPYGSYSIPVNKAVESLVRLSITEKAASEILAGSGVDPDIYKSKVNAGESYSLQQTEKQLYLKTSVINKQIPVKNIIGIIPGNNPEKVIVLGAHYDHMGIGNGYIWNGADDNASGTVGVMTIARAIMATGKKPEKTIIVALWTAEEEGLLGSRYWIQNPTTPLKNVVINVNFDMISRYINETEQKKVTMTYTDAYPVFREFTEANIKAYGLDLLVDYQPSPDPPGGTDHRSFVAAGIPIMRFKPGHREEYHTPKDELSTIDWDIMEKIIKISFLNVYDLSEKNW